LLEEEIEEEDEIEAFETPIKRHIIIAVVIISIAILVSFVIVGMLTSGEHDTITIKLVSNYQFDPQAHFEIDGKAYDNFTIFHYTNSTFVFDDLDVKTSHNVNLYVLSAFQKYSAACNSATKSVSFEVNYESNTIKVECSKCE